jgi:hypothetical protein
MKTVSKTKSPGETILKIALCTFLVGVALVSFSAPYLAELDKWMDNIEHQMWTTIAIAAMLSIVYLWRRARK